MLLSALLDVPYLAQTPELCGGAAVAMVMRYWGATDVFPQDFAPLVNRAEAGIETGTLAAAVHSRGWQAFVLPADDTTGLTGIRRELDAGRPLIALIAVGPRLYHYVVIVGVTDDNIVVHDPARAPFRVLARTEFDRAWSAANRWLMLMLPPATIGRPATSAPVLPGAGTPRAATACSALVDRGVQLAVDKDAAESERVLNTAISLCPRDPAPLRELAGLRFSQKRWFEAERSALSATRLVPDDAYAWQLVGSSRYLSGDAMGALAAWNRTGAPRVDTIDIQGVQRTPQPVIVRAAGLEPRALLTPDRLRRAERRLGELPVADGARVAYTPIDDTRATVNVFMDERARLPGGRWTFANMAARALLYHEVRIETAGLIGAGDAAHAMWRWDAGRPRVETGVSLPAPGRIQGVVSFDASWERQSYAVAHLAVGATERESRRRAGLHLADWPTGWFRWSAGAALDRFNGRGYVTGDVAVDLQPRNDQLALALSGSVWTPARGGPSLTTASALIAWRSTNVAARERLSSRLELSIASRTAPLALWPGAGTGQGRAGLLRAHVLVHDGVIDGPAFGRTMAMSSTEYARPLRGSSSFGVSMAVFVDAARAWRRMPGLDSSPLYIDAGLGLRLRAPGQRREMRIDVARGLRGGGLTLSAGWTTGWPR